MTEEREEVFRGHFNECFIHMKERFEATSAPRSKNRLKPLKPLMDFCGVEENTVRNWLRKEDPNICGELYVRVTCFLDLNGYKVIEFERCDKGIRNFVELIAYRVISVEDALNILHMPRISGLFAMFRGDRGVSSERHAKMWDFWKSTRNEIFQKKKMAAEKYRLSFLSRSKEVDKPIEEMVRAMAEPTSSIESRRTATMYIMYGLRSLLDEGILKNLSAEELGDLSHEDVLCVSSLSAHFSTLASDIVRKKAG
ncbi:MAG: hypothetical protein V4690_00255 [Patescibacteria group bacterium]